MRLQRKAFHDEEQGNDADPIVSLGKKSPLKDGPSPAIGGMIANDTQLAHIGHRQGIDAIARSAMIAELLAVLKQESQCNSQCVKKGSRRVRLIM